MKIEKQSASRWFKCVCCGEQIRTDEKYIQVMHNGKPVKRERYCLGCECYAYENNDIDAFDDNDGERGLRQREDYAAYQAAGCVDEYWNDRDNGYCN
jgi:hypothetical protein